MTAKSLPAPKTISRAARDFINNAEPLTHLSNDLAQIKAARQYNEENGLPKALKFAQNQGVSWFEETIAGEPVLRIKPKKPGPDATSKAILYFYGGGHIVGSPEEDLPIIAPVANHLGIEVLAHRYPLAPEAPFPAAVNASAEVYQHMTATYGEGHWAIMGESAGGNLALAALLNARDQGWPLPAAAVLLSPWVDLSGQNDSLNYGFDPTLSLESMGDSAAMAYMNNDPAKATNPLVSPIHGNYDGQFPPTLITTGTRDFLLSDCARISTRLRQSGVDVSLHLWEGLWHVFEFYPDLPEAEKSLEEVANFLKQHLQAEL